MCSYLRPRSRSWQLSKVQHIMKEIVEVARLIPQECLQHALEEIVDILVGLFNGILLDRVSKRFVDQTVDLPAPPIHVGNHFSCEVDPSGVPSTHR